MSKFSRRWFLGAGGGFAAGLAAYPILSEGFLATEALGQANIPDRSTVAWLNSNENPYGPCPLAAEAITRSIPEACRYPMEAARQLMEELARLHGVSRDMIVVGNGSSEVLRMAAGAFLGPGKTLIAPELTYESPDRYAQVTGADVQRVPLTDDFRHDVRAMLKAGEGASVGLIYACNPNNPTASLTPKDQMEALIAGAPRGSVVLVDEAYHHFVDSPSYESALRLVQAGKDVIVSRTFSKIYGLAGMRIGYAIARSELAGQLRRQALHLNLNGPGLQAAIASLQDRDLVSRNAEKNARARRILTDWLDRNKLRYAPSHANFVFFETGKPVNEVAPRMWQQGVAVGRAFPPMTNWLRVSVGTEEEMRRFLTAYLVAKQ